MVLCMSCLWLHLQSLSYKLEPATNEEDGQTTVFAELDTSKECSRAKFALDGPQSKRGRQLIVLSKKIQYWALQQIWFGPSPSFWVTYLFNLVTDICSNACAAFCHDVWAQCCIDFSFISFLKNCKNNQETPHIIQNVHTATSWQNNCHAQWCAIARQKGDTMAMAPELHV